MKVHYIRSVKNVQKIKDGKTPRKVGMSHIVQNFELERRIWDAAVTYLNCLGKTNLGRCVGGYSINN